MEVKVISGSVDAVKAVSELLIDVICELCRMSALFNTFKLVFMVEIDVVSLVSELFILFKVVCNDDDISTYCNGEAV
jgi:hypothetical protein